MGDEVVVGAIRKGGEFIPSQWPISPNATPELLFMSNKSAPVLVLAPTKGTRNLKAAKMSLCLPKKA
jgi:hypothetical protein